MYEASIGAQKSSFDRNQGGFRIEWRHEMQRIRAWLIVGLSLLILSVPVPGGAQEENTPIDPQADSILRQMSDYMNTLGQFIVRAENGADTLLSSGQILQMGRSMEVFVRRPDRLRGNMNGGRFDQEFYYDGKSITLFSKGVNYYATTEAPSTIEAALDEAEQSFGLVAPFADLISQNAYDTLIEDVTLGIYVGLSNVLGVECHQLAFRGEETDWQIWIENSERPLPRKFMITSKWVTGAPRFVGLITDWDLSPELQDSLFTFAVPEGARMIDFLPPDN